MSGSTAEILPSNGDYLSVTAWNNEKFLVFCQFEGRIVTYDIVRVGNELVMYPSKPLKITPDESGGLEIGE